MLTISGPSNGRLCDGFSRRDFLRIGGLAMGGLGLPDLLKAEAEARTGRQFKSIIMIYLCGAPPHQDMWDLKMDAPLEIRGPYEPFRVIPDSQKRIISCQPTEPNCDRNILSALARRAWRRPVTTTELDAIARVATRARAAGDTFEQSIQPYYFGPH